MDRAADTFARILQSAAATVDDPVRRRVLEQMFYHLGRWIYLVDAADDLREDAAAGRYNPVALRYGLTDGKWTEESRQAFAKTLDQSVHMIATAFELWDFGVWRPLLENTVYTALFAVGRAVLEGDLPQTIPQAKRERNTRRLRRPHERSLSDPGRVGERLRRGDQKSIPGAGPEVPSGQLSRQSPWRIWPRKR